MSHFPSSADLAAIGRERILDVRDFIVVSFYRIRAAPHAGRAVMAGFVLVGALGAGAGALKHRFSHRAETALAAAAVPALAAPPAPAAAPPAPAPLAAPPPEQPKIDMRVTGSIAPVDEPVKKKKKKARRHKKPLDSDR